MVIGGHNGRWAEWGGGEGLLRGGGSKLVVRGKWRRQIFRGRLTIEAV